MALAQLFAILFLWNQASGEVLVVQADTDVAFYLNGVEQFPDTSSPVLPMNGVRRINMGETTVQTYRTSRTLIAGDLIALQVNSRHAALINVTDALGRNIEYPAYVGIIIVAEEGTMTTSQFKCSTQRESTDDQRTPFQMNAFNDSHWLPAFEQSNNCCPWRDPLMAWERFAAHWVGLRPSTFAGNVSGPREMFCRYTVMGNDLVSRLPAEETALSSDQAPVLTINEVKVSVSISKIDVYVDRQADVYCGVIDVRYELRVPTHLELKSWGVAYPAAPGTTFGYQTIGDTEFTSFEIDHPSLVRLSVDDLEACQARCSNMDACAALVYWAQGFDISTGTNCKLMNASYNASVRLPGNDFSSMQLKKRIVVPVIATLTYSGMLLPGTLYNVYCSCEDPVSGLHSNISFITSTRVTQRTEGCTDCGSTDPPAVSMLGGWVRRNSVGIAAAASRTGRVFCHMRQLTTATTLQVTAEEVQSEGFSNLATVGGQTIVIIITGLEISTPYQVACVAEADGGLLSTQQQIDATRRRLNTSATEVTISGMGITREESAADPMFHVMRASVQATQFGYLFCQVFPSEAIQLQGVPNVPVLEEIADRGKITDLQQDVVAEFDELDPNISYEIWCTARYDDFSNETDAQLITTPYPVVRIESAEVSYQSSTVRVSASKSPAHIYCNAYPWAFRPTSQRPDAPSYERIVQSRFETVLELTGPSGVVVMDIGPLSAGTFYDIYCYSEFYRPPAPPGSIQPPRQGMTNQEILETRYAIHTKGPQFDELGWECVSGRNCSIENILGDSVSSLDQVMVRTDECPSRCQCLGQVDPNRKGGSCTAISQDPVVVSGVGIEDKRDPRGRWCYVAPGACLDEEISAVFPSMVLSYKVCTFDSLVGRLATSGPDGFPNNGLAIPVPSSLGRAYVISSGSMVAPGASYSLCWCNGTESSCTTEGDFRVRLGALHIAGPSAEQRVANVTCRAGLPCVVRHFEGHALELGSRLVVLPYDVRGCLWRRASLADPRGLVDFPNLGVSEPFDKPARVYSFFGDPLIIQGGIYTMCWCGAPARTWDIAPGQNYRIPNGIVPPPCPPTRADDGGFFLSPAGQLVIIGPEPVFDMVSCRLGAVCETPLIQGLGLQGSDRVAVLKDCGVAAEAPLGWSDGVESLDDQWISDGWATMASDFSAQELYAFGIPLEKLGLSMPPTTVNLTFRGIFGFPNFGLSVPHATPGLYGWDGPTWAFADTYRMCWCGADATIDGCRSASDFLVPIGFLQVTGPGVLPFAAQMFTCVRLRQCELEGLAGTQPPWSKLLVAEGLCGGPSLRGMPGVTAGVSFPSADGRHFRWGSDRVLSNPGRYSLCWCSTITTCDRYQDFQSYAAVLQIKAPLSSPLSFFCPLARLCNISGIRGEGLNDHDKVMVLTKCSDAVFDPEAFPNGASSLSTFDSGGSFLLPPAVRAGVYQICWCAGEQLCLNAADYIVTLGRLTIGGPGDSVTYRCFEWEPCSIDDLEGQLLSDGDRLMVVADGTDCAGNRSLVPQEGFPNRGVSLPATGDGKRFSWGEGLVLAAPGVYALCWCHAPYNNGTCTEEGPFNVPGGVIRVGDSKEFQYVTRPADNPPRTGDDAIAILLAVPLPLLFFFAITFGIKRLIGRKMYRQDEAPNPWAERRGLDDMQQRSKMRGEVQEVAATRTNIARLVENRTHQQKSNEGLLALYGLLRQFTHRWKKKKKKVLTRGNAGLVQQTKSVRSVTSNTTHTSTSSKRYGSSISVESSDEDLFDRPKAPPKTTPKPPSLEFFSVNDPRVLHMLDEEEQPRTIVSYVSDLEDLD